MQIECKRIDEIQMTSNNSIRLELENVDNYFIRQLEVKDICQNVEQEELFKELMTYDDMKDVLEAYIEEKGYI